MRYHNGTSSLRSQIGASSWGGRRYAPYVFTEQGVAMLSSVLNGNRAIQVTIQIMRTFAKLREMIATHKDFRAKIEAMERKYDTQFRLIFTAIETLLSNTNTSTKPIGFQSRT